ncbi:hypothetical protein Bca4012_037086 [Brassica carinata]
MPGVVSSVMLNGKRTNLEEEEDAHQIVSMNESLLHLSQSILELSMLLSFTCNLLIRINASVVQSIDQDEKNMNMMEKDGQGNDEKVEKSAEPTSSNMVLKNFLLLSVCWDQRGARYFDHPDAGGWETCYSCGEQGHVTINCPTPTRRKKSCFICGSLEHAAKQCTKGRHDCYICKKGGHRAKDCPDKYQKSGSAVCLRCGHSGHDMILCKYHYSRDDLKAIQCYVCKRFGHLCCVEPGNSPSWAVSCYRCGHLGHIGLACGGEESTAKDSASSCSRCGEEGHFSRECPNSWSHGRDSPSLCYRCNGAGHFARECPNSPQVSKRNRETSTPSHKSHKKIKETLEYSSKTMKKKKSKENVEHYSTPHEPNGKMKNKKKGEPSHSTPQKPKNRGGWITEDDYFQRGKMRSPSGHYNHHRSTTYMAGGHNYRSPTFHSCGNFPTTPYGRNSSFESSGHHHNHRYAPAPSRYRYDEFQGNYGPW